MDFDPHSKVIQLCMEGMRLEAASKASEAGVLYLEAWEASVHDFERFYAAWFLARGTQDPSARLKWLETALKVAQDGDNAALKTAYSAIDASIAECHAALGHGEESKDWREEAERHRLAPEDAGPFFHGTKADLKLRDLLQAGGSSNYQAGLKMNHIYFTALVNGAGLAAELAKGDGEARVYVVEPTGPFENDPNVTDKKFPGNPTRSYRSESPLKVVGELRDWTRMSPEALRAWRSKVDGNKGKIIN